MQRLAQPRSRKMPCKARTGSRRLRLSKHAGVRAPQHVTIRRPGEESRRSSAAFLHHCSREVQTVSALNELIPPRGKTIGYETPPDSSLPR